MYARIFGSSPFSIASTRAFARRSPLSPFGTTKRGTTGAAVFFAFGALGAGATESSLGG